MKRHILKVFITTFVLFIASNVSASMGGSTPRLHVEGQFLKDPHGNTVNLHGRLLTIISETTN